MRLLVVNDHNSYCELIRDHADMLSHNLKIECQFVQDGTRALEMIRDWNPSVVLLDAHVSGMSSFEILVNRKEEGVPIVVTSLHHSQEIEASALAKGATAYIRRSENPEDVEGLLYKLASLSQDNKPTH